MKRIGIWLRVSTEDQVRGESPEHHEERARAYAKAKDWTVVEVYRLDAVSGKSVKEHTEARRMLADIRRGHITGLVFSKLARLARNTRELLEFSEEFQKCGADLISLQESIDTSSAAGRLFYTIIGAVAQWEREETSERVAASVPVRARLGKPVGGAAVFGYRWQDGKLVPDPEEAPVRRLIYELYRTHKRKGTVASLLNARGYRTRDGSAWGATSVGRLIADPTAKGERVANRCRSAGDGCGWTLKPESEWVRVPVEAIVSEELWNECNGLAAETGGKYKKHRGRSPVYLFAGVIHCGRCGRNRKLYRQTGWNKYRCYKCSTKIAEDDLEAIFLEQLSGFLLSEERVDEMLAESLQEGLRRQALAEGLRKDRGELTKRADALVDLYQQGAVDVDEFKSRHVPVRDRLREIEAELARIEKEALSLSADTKARRQALADGVRLREEWPRMTFDQKRRVVESLVDRITISGEEVELNLNYIPGALAEKSDRIPPGLTVPAFSVNRGENLPVSGLTMPRDPPIPAAHEATIPMAGKLRVRRGGGSPDPRCAVPWGAVSGQTAQEAGWSGAGPPTCEHWNVPAPASRSPRPGFRVLGGRGLALVLSPCRLFPTCHSPCSALPPHSPRSGGGDFEAGEEARHY